MRTGIAWMIAACLLTACGLPTDPLPEEPAAGPMDKGPVFISSTEVLLLESYPVQVNLHVKGSLPTPCHTPVWAVSGPDEKGRIVVDLHSETPAGLACAEVLQDLDLTIPLGAFTEANYTVFLNGESVGEVRLP